MIDAYLVWSHEHGAWWGPARQGYKVRLSEAGRYSHEEALRICAEAIPGDAATFGALQELPVREADVLEMRARYRTKYPGRPLEAWE